MSKLEASWEEFAGDSSSSTLESICEGIEGPLRVSSDATLVRKTEAKQEWLTPEAEKWLELRTKAARTVRVALCEPRTARANQG